MINAKKQKVLHSQGKKRVRILIREMNEKKILLSNELSDIHQYLTEIAVLRAKGKHDGVKGKVSELLKKYSLTEISKSTEIPYYKVRRMIGLPQKEKNQDKYIRKLTDDFKQKVANFYLHPSISYNLPDMRYCRRRYMRVSLKEAYEIFNQGSGDERKIGFSTFAKLKPEEVLSINKTPSRQCCCEICENFRTIIMSMKRHKFRGVGSNMREAVMDSLCGAEIIPNSGETSLEFTKMPKKSCSLRMCNECGILKEKKRLITENVNLLTSKKKIRWSQWVYTKKSAINDKRKSEQRKLIQVKYVGTAQDLLNMYISQLDSIAKHHFYNCWQMYQFSQSRANLQDHQVLLVQDFARNFIIDFQDEPAGLHWKHDQVTVHPTIIYYPCRTEGCKELVTQEVIHISQDLHHDPPAVNTYKEDALSYLKSLGISFDEVLIWTDQSPTQYKSIRVFHFLANDNIPTCHHYYPVRHGKNPADGASGRVKLAFKRGKLSRENNIRNARELFQYTCDAMDTELDNSKCQHFRTKIMFIEQVERKEEEASDTILQTQKIHSVRSTGNKNIVQIKNTTCCCVNCVVGKECLFPDFSEPWILKSTVRGQSLKDIQINHWKTKNLTSDEEQFRLECSRYRLGILEERKEKRYQRYNKIHKKMPDEKELHKINMATELSCEKVKEEKPPKEQNEVAIDTTDEIIQKIFTNTIKKKRIWTRRRNKKSTRKPILTLRNERKTRYTARSSKEKCEEKIDVKKENLSKEFTTKSKIMPPRRKNVKVTKQEVKKCNKTITLGSLKGGDIIHYPIDPCNIKQEADSEEEITDYWSEIQTRMDNIHDYKSLENYVNTLDLPPIEFNYKCKKLKTDKEDVISKFLWPDDAPDLVPIATEGLGSCFCCSISHLVFGTQKRFTEVRIRIIVEGILHKARYLNNEHLYKGAMHRGQDYDIVGFYALTSPAYNLVKFTGRMNEEITEKIYEMELLSVSKTHAWMGMWQVHMIANCLQQPIRTVYPCVNMNVRDDYNRFVYPENVTNNKELNIMWTSSNNVSFSIDHFVPLMQRN